MYARSARRALLRAVSRGFALRSSALEPGKAEVNPGSAATLGIIPGLGAVYNGEYMKALIHVLIFAGLIAALSSDLPDSATAFVIVAFICFCFYMPIEAYARRALAATDNPSPRI